MNCIPHEWLVLILVTRPSRGTSSEYSIFAVGTTWMLWRRLATTCLPPAGGPPSTWDGASVGVPKHQVFPKHRGLVSYYRSSSGDSAILAPGGPPNNHEMGDPMTRNMAVAGTTKYSEYRALRGVPGDFHGQKFFAERAISCTALSYRLVIRRHVAAQTALPAPPRHLRVEQ